MYRLFTLSLLIFSLPVGGLISVGILLTSGFPILFTQKRVGKNGTQFILIKFRTMVQGSDRMQKDLQQRNEAGGPVFKIRNDPRFTPIGKFLSHTGLDELPQLWNVLRGDMALFGPRPLPVPEANKLKAWQKERYRIKPGIISPWILEGYHRTSFDDWMKSDIAYSKKKSVSYDLMLFVRSILFMLRLFAKELIF
ncbi:sugar transferase [Candidatus Gottesmanbacteria bacterium]|nr:sugar transferase [Candidatus Gottesmanbacteria bacterium]